MRFVEVGKKIKGTDRVANGVGVKPKTKRPARGKKPVPELPQEIRKLTLKAFRLAYEANQRKSV